MRSPSETPSRKLLVHNVAVRRGLLLLTPAVPTSRYAAAAVGVKHSSCDGLCFRCRRHPPRRSPAAQPPPTQPPAPLPGQPSAPTAAAACAAACAAAAAGGTAATAAARAAAGILAQRAPTPPPLPTARARCRQPGRRRHRCHPLPRGCGHRHRAPPPQQPPQQGLPPSPLAPSQPWAHHGHASLPPPHPKSTGTPPGCAGAVLRATAGQPPPQPMPLPLPPRTEATARATAAARAPSAPRRRPPPRPAGTAHRRRRRRDAAARRRAAGGTRASSSCSAGRRASRPSARASPSAACSRRRTPASPAAAVVAVELREPRAPRSAAGGSGDGECFARELPLAALFDGVVGEPAEALFERVSSDDKRVRKAAKATRKANAHFAELAGVFVLGVGTTGGLTVGAAAARRPARASSTAHARCRLARGGDDRRIDVQTKGRRGYVRACVRPPRMITIRQAQGSVFNYCILCSATP